ncbi:MAG: stalk domain-containing protein, partial [bacterium]
MSHNSRTIFSAKSSIKFHLVPTLLLTFLPFFTRAQDLEWERKIESHARRIDGDFYFVSLQDVAETLNAHTYYSNKVRKAILYLGDEKITVTAFNPFVLIGKNVVQMPIDTEYADGDIWLPVKFFLPILKNVILSSKGSYANGKGLYDFVHGINITGVRVEEKANGTLIRVKVTKEFDKSSLSTRYSRKWLYLDILNGRIDEQTFYSSFDQGLVVKIVPVQQDQMVQLSFQLKKDISGQDLQITQYP